MSIGQTKPTLPANTYCRRGYFSWKDPRTKKEYGLGKDARLAIAQAKEANNYIADMEQKLRRQRALLEHERAKRGDLDDGGLMKIESIRILSSPARITGVYFLMFEGDVVYVGKSTDCGGRITAHMRGKDAKQFDAHYILRTRPEHLDDLEAAYIHKFKPKYNITIHPHRERDMTELHTTDWLDNHPLLATPT